MLNFLRSCEHIVLTTEWSSSDEMRVSDSTKNIFYMNYFCLKVHTHRFLIYRPWNRKKTITKYSSECAYWKKKNMSDNTRSHPVFHYSFLAFINLKNWIIVLIPHLKVSLSKNPESTYSRASCTVLSARWLPWHKQYPSEQSGYFQPVQAHSVLLSA